MIKEWNKKIISLIICVVFLLMFVSNTIVGADIEHLFTCHENGCAKCEIMHKAQESLKTLVVLILISYFAIISYILFYFYFDIKAFIPPTLIDLKIQLNE